jgi:hypothetical protein
MKIYPNHKPKVLIDLEQFITKMIGDDLILDIKQYLIYKISNGIENKIIPHIKDWNVEVLVQPEYDYKLTINLLPEMLMKYVEII